MQWGARALLEWRALRDAGSSVPRYSRKERVRPKARARQAELSYGGSCLLASPRVRGWSRLGSAWFRRLACLARLDDVYLLAIDQGVGRVLDDFVRVLESGSDLDRSAVVAPDGDGHQFRDVVIHDGNAQALGAEHQRRNGDDHRWMRIPQLKVDLRVGSGIQLAFAVVHIDFDQKGA